jgi:hypothetical protein
LSHCPHGWGHSPNDQLKEHLHQHVA